jgi:hypothetical protein
MRYFHISSGLRGCYLSDDCSVIAVKSRRELRHIVAEECGRSRDAYGYGGSQRAISAAVAQVWRGYRTQRLDSAVQFGRERGSYPFGVFISPATRTEYLESQEEC